MECPMSEPHWSTTEPEDEEICSPCFMDDCFACDDDGCQCPCESKEPDDDAEPLAEVVPLRSEPADASP